MVDVSRAHVVAAARGWLDTPWRHQGRTRGLAVDCVGLLIGVARELGLVEANWDFNGYSRVPQGRELIDLCERHMTRVGKGAMQPGDVVVVTMDRDPQHVGIVGNYWHGQGVHSIIHALGPGAPDRVVETRLLFHQRMRFAAAYALPGIA